MSKSKRTLEKMLPATESAAAATKRASAKEMLAAMREAATSENEQSDFFTKTKVK